MGTKITFSKLYLSLTSEATIKCPIWMGSKVPPKMPILLEDFLLGFTLKENQKTNRGIKADCKIV